MIGSVLLANEQLAHHILSFLNIGDLGRLMLVSRRCNSLCVSVPCLTVDNRNHTHNLISRLRFNQLVDKFLALRANAGTKIRDLTLVCSFQLHGGLRKVASCGAERLSLDMVCEEGGPCFFQAAVLWSGSVKDLFCSNNCAVEFSHSFPIPFRSSSGLESLTLQSADIHGEKFSDAMFELMSLKSLYLYDCNGSGVKKLSIRNSSLEQLKITNEKPVELCHLYVNAPKLEKFSDAMFELMSLKSLYLYDCNGSGVKKLSIRNSSLEQLKITNEKPVELCHLYVNAPKLEKFYHSLSTMCCTISDTSTWIRSGTFFQIFCQK
ncbi:hypothetical protein DITRI_Ditri07aG0014900 [Diplodiscus trichospermus]